MVALVVGVGPVAGGSGARRMASRAASTTAATTAAEPTEDELDALVGAAFDVRLRPHRGDERDLDEGGDGERGPCQGHGAPRVRTPVPARTSCAASAATAASTSNRVGTGTSPGRRTPPARQSSGRSRRSDSRTVSPATPRVRVPTSRHHPMPVRTSRPPCRSTIRPSSRRAGRQAPGDLSRARRRSRARVSRRAGRIGSLAR